MVRVIFEVGTRKKEGVDDIDKRGALKEEYLLY